MQSTLAKLALCRTAALGGHRYRCDRCQHECVLYNSCGDRHCGQCAGAKRADWMDSTKKLLLEGVDYFQVVFTLPSELSSLALGNRRAIYNLLFASAWSALKQTIATEQGYDAAALLVLHTWNQQLEQHGHVHAVVPGGGPALDGSGWVNSRRPGGDAGHYLVDAIALRGRYRDVFLDGLERLRQRDELKLEEDRDGARWESLIWKLRRTEWVIHIQPPPERADGQPCSAEQVLKYLARYLTGGPISDGRIIAADQQQVTFWAREGKTVGGDRRQVPITLETLEFMRRWCLHILPRGFTKTRCYGGWHNRRRETYLERCAILLESTAALLPEESLDFPTADHDDPSSANRQPPEKECPSCGSELRLTESTEKPSWSDIMSSLARPVWYRQPSRSSKKLATKPQNTIESAKASNVAEATKLNARSIPLHPTPG